jgi:hypothetical protein
VEACTAYNCIGNGNALIKKKFKELKDQAIAKIFDPDNLLDSEQCERHTADQDSFETLSRDRGKKL